MALAYSQSEWFVPDSRELIDSYKASDRRCVWHKAKRAPKKDGAHLVRCSNTVLELEATTADQLIRGLSYGSDQEDRHLKVLKQISPLLLCKNNHRSLNAATIFDYWAKESNSMGPGSIQEAPTQQASPRRPHNVAQKSPVAQVQERLGLALGFRMRCHGKGQESECGNWINKSNIQRIVTITEELAGDWRLSNSTVALLKELAGLIMCTRRHQYQAHAKVKEWTILVQIRERPKMPGADCVASPQTLLSSGSRNSAAFENTETQTSSVQSFPRNRPLQTTIRTAKSPERKSERVGSSSPSSNERYPPEVARSCEQPRISPTPVSSRTRSARSAGESVRANTLPSFEPLATVKTPLEVAEYVMQKIREKLSVNEVASGFVYGFRRLGSDLIKIGTTRTTVAKRMKSIATNCNYTPTVVFQVPTNHAMKVEHLVHRHLYRQNRRECLTDGLCNGGRGCAARHKEWFEGVSVEYAETVVRSWVRWMTLEPYDMEGVLKYKWLVRTKLFNLNSPGDIWMRWTELTLVTVVKNEAEERLTDAARAEKALRRVQELVAAPRRQIGRQNFAFTAPRIRQVDVFA